MAPGLDDGAPSHKPHVKECSRCVVLRCLRQGGIRGEALSSLCGKLWLNRVCRRQILFLEGNRATHLYALRRGSVKLVRTDGGGRAHIIALLGPGDLFGLEAVFGECYESSAEVLDDDTEVCVGARREIEAILDQGSAVVKGLAGYVHDQLSVARSQQACLGSVGSRARLAAFLLHRVDTNRGEDGADALPENLTLRDLGSILGLSPETVCRALGGLRSKGYIETAAGRTRVLDVDGLKRLARL